jgi:hypothetical protein
MCTEVKMREAKYRQPNEKHSSNPTLELFPDSEVMEELRDVL